MATRTAHAQWEGNLKEGKGNLKVGSNAFDSPYSFQSRFEEGPGTNPEELIAAAHAGCFSMALSHGLTEAGHPPKTIHTTGRVELKNSNGSFSIPHISLETEAEVPGIDDETFQEQAEKAKKNCPVSKLMVGAEITLKAKLL